jgi:hypothetical protein
MVKKKGGEEMGSSGRVPALQVQSSEFKYQSHQKRKGKK